MNSANEPTTDVTGQPLQVTRRGMLAVGAVGVSATALAACSKAASPGARSAQSTGNSPAGSSSAGSPAAGASSGSAAGGAPLAKLADIKVGEAISATGPDGAKIIIARPSQTTVAAFSAICTHQSCTVAPAGKELDCPCHGSVYNATTGEVINGPAPRPLAKVQVHLSGDNVVAG